MNFAKNIDSFYLRVVSIPLMPNKELKTKCYFQVAFVFLLHSIKFMTDSGPVRMHLMISMADGNQNIEILLNLLSTV